MKTIQLLVAFTLLGAASANAQISMPDPTIPGGSMETAVRILTASDFMVDRFIKRWIRTHYPGWNAEPHEIQEFGSERYAVVYITSASNPGRRVYFRLVSSQHDDDSGGSFPLP